MMTVIKVYSGVFNLIRLPKTDTSIEKYQVILLFCDTTVFLETQYNEAKIYRNKRFRQISLSLLFTSNVAFRIHQSPRSQRWGGCSTHSGATGNSLKLPVTGFINLFTHHSADAGISATMPHHPLPSKVTSVLSLLFICPHPSVQL